MDPAPAKVWPEYQHDDNQRLPVAAGGASEVTWVPRRDGGRHLGAQVEPAAFDATGHFGWVACDMATTRAVAKVLRADYRIERGSLNSQAYWHASKGL